MVWPAVIEHDLLGHNNKAYVMMENSRFSAEQTPAKFQVNILDRCLMGDSGLMEGFLWIDQFPHIPWNWYEEIATVTQRKTQPVEWGVCWSIKWFTPSSVYYNTCVQYCAITLNLNMNMYELVFWRYHQPLWFHPVVDKPCPWQRIAKDRQHELWRLSSLSPL